MTQDEFNAVFDEGAKHTMHRVEENLAAALQEALKESLYASANLGTMAQIARQAVVDILHNAFALATGTWVHGPEGRARMEAAIDRLKLKAKARE